MKRKRTKFKHCCLICGARIPVKTESVFYCNDCLDAFTSKNYYYCMVIRNLGKKHKIKRTKRPFTQTELLEKNGTAYIWCDFQQAFKYNGVCTRTCEKLCPKYKSYMEGELGNGIRNTADESENED